MSPRESDPGTNLHELSPEDFYADVHSFEHWLASIQSYLEIRPRGHQENLSDEGLEAEDRDGLIAVLCSYGAGETAALECSGALIRLAPNRPTKVFLATQCADEARHLEVFCHRLRELGVEDPEAEIESRSHPALRTFHTRLLELIERGAWLPALFAQNVILEAMEFSVFRGHAKTADPVTRDLLLAIVSDERRHIGFGESEIGRRLQAGEITARELGEVRRDFDPLVFRSFEETLRDIGAPRERGDELARDYLDAVGRLGVE
ncbi:MAG: hypothetical protein CL910_08560 [Deltaproteobacteria bacterium]|nr:hypothetical protein [Deltaproteobacteria bacterium]